MIDTGFVNQVNELSEQTVELCYHCHKCTSGCPVADEMTYGPDRILRLIQLGDSAALLTSSDIWVCASCETCGTRCPNEIDIARVMDALRHLAIAEGVTIAEPDAIKFHRLFLSLIQRMGRMHEATLLSLYLLWTRGILDYVGTGAAMFTKGKVPLIPRPIKARAELKRMFEDTSK
jgi:heterodisulfide reductase subunit C